MGLTLLVQGHRGSLQSNPIRERFQPLPSSAGRDFMHRFSGVLLAILCLALGSASASAQGAYPNKTIRVLIPYAPGGIGAYQHVNTEILAKRAGGLQLVHIPFKDGGSGILKDIAGGDTHVSWFNVANPVGMIKAGKVRPLAVAADARLPAWPDVPTIAEVGFPGFRPSQWSAAFAPAGVPREIIDKLHEAFAAAARTPEMQSMFEKAGMIAPVDKNADAARAWLRNEMETWRRDIADAGIKVDSE